jgi:hypothetical protein
LHWDLETVNRDRTPEDQFVSRVREVRDGAGWAANEIAGLIRADENS